MRTKSSYCQALFLLPALLFLCTLSLSAQESPPVEIRYSYFDPLKGDHELFLLNAKTGEPEQIVLAGRSLSRQPIPVKRVNGKVHFLRDGQLEKEELLKPENIAFSLAVPIRITKAAIVIIASGNRLHPVLVDDSPGKFPYGHSRLINATNVAVGIRAGEHSKGVRPGKMASIPAVKKVNEYNQARVSFECQLDEVGWLVLSKKLLPFNNGRRRIWIAYATKGVKKPAIATIVDSR